MDIGNEDIGLIGFQELTQRSTEMHRDTLRI
jgi:hypothetical protein